MMEAINVELVFEEIGQARLGLTLGLGKDVSLHYKATGLRLTESPSF